jgi:hypothetical protein
MVACALFSIASLVPLRAGAVDPQKHAILQVIVAYQPGIQSSEFHVRSRAPAANPSGAAPTTPHTFVIVVTNVQDTSCTEVVSGEVDYSGLGGAVVTASIDGSDLSAFGEVILLPACFDGSRVSMAFGPIVGRLDPNEVAGGTANLGPPIFVSASVVKESDGTTVTNIYSNGVAFAVYTFDP